MILASTIIIKKKVLNMEWGKWVWRKRLGEGGVVLITGIKVSCGTFGKLPIVENVMSVIINQNLQIKYIIIK